MTLPDAAVPAPSIPAQDSGPRLALFTHSEAHDLLRLLQLVTDEDDELAEEASWFARQLEARIPPEN
ncbi:DUF6417 family protein [Streptomyces sp. NPDC004111]|uniref:DUF6417 family protein n=1 Tax=Streptomyces sp. NPDC004111 TaxID=3364690 RepID=UPI0036BD636B